MPVVSMLSCLLSVHLKLFFRPVAFLQVYVSVYADGPTRVLRFADEKSTALLEDQQSILDLAARLKQASVSPRTLCNCSHLPLLMSNRAGAK